MTKRLPDTETKYTQAKTANSLRPIHDETPIRDFIRWRIVQNRFPHDKIAEVNHMLVLKRKAERHTLRLDELAELHEIIETVQHEYDCLVYNLPSVSSVLDTPHMHLYKLKQEYK